MRDVEENVLESNFKIRGRSLSGGGGIWRDEQQDSRDGWKTQGSYSGVWSLVHVAEQA